MRYFAIRTENLTRYYGRRRGIENLSIEVEPGEIFGLVGPGGAGKTTVVRLLLDTLRPTRGYASVLGLDCHRESKVIRQQTGYIPLEFSLYNHMTVSDYINHCARQRGPAALQRGLELIHCFGLSPLRRIVQLTRAEKRKLGLIFAFMHRPELYILDEPTLGLTRPEADEFYRLVSDARSEGHAVFLSSRSLMEVERICDRAGLINAGELVSLERGVQLRSRAIRQVEIRFASPVDRQAFISIPNVENLRLVDNRLYCTVHGEPDALVKAASQYRITDLISQQVSLEEALSAYYGIGEEISPLS